MAKKRTAVVGFGFMGMTHASNIIKSERLELTAIIDKDLKGIDQKLESETGNFSAGKVDPALLHNIRKYKSLAECLESEELEVVYVCVHTDLHYTIAREALEHGLHVFLEKPMTLDTGKGAELIKLAMDKGAILMVGHVLRFMPPYTKLKHWIDSGEYGELKFLSMSRFSGVPSWGQWKEKQKAYGSSGGALFDLLIHDIDFLQYALGLPDGVESFYLPGALSEHDYVRARWKYKGRDLVVMVEGGDTFHSNFPFHAAYSARFEKASVLYTTFRPDIIQVATDAEIQELDAGDADLGFYNETEYFAQCVEKGEAPVQCLPESALQTIELCYEHIITG